MRFLNLRYLALPLALVVPALATVRPAPASEPPGVDGGYWKVLGAAAHLPTFFVPTGLALDRQNDVYIADSGNFRVVKLSPSGAVLARIGSRGALPGQFAPALTTSPAYPPVQTLGPDSIAVARSGNVVVADPGNGRIDIFSSSGQFVTYWDVFPADSQPRPLAVAVAPNGNIVDAYAAQVNCNPGPAEFCPSYYVVQRRNASGSVIGEWRSATPSTLPQTTSNAISHISLAVDHRGNIYVASSGTLLCYKSCPSFGFVDKRSASGRLLAQWGGYSLGKARTPSALAVGGRNNLFIAETSTHHIEKRSPAGKLLDRIGQFSAAFLGRLSPAGVAVAAGGDIYATDTDRGLVVKLSSSGRLLSTWGASGSAHGRLLHPDAVALQRDGTAYVYDSGNGRMAKFSAAGAFLGTFRLAGPAPSGALGIFSVGAIGLATDRTGDLYIGQVIRGKVCIGKFAPNGRLLARFGQGMHMATIPSGLAVDRWGNITAAAEFEFPYVPGAPPPVAGVMILKLSPSGRQLMLVRPPYQSAPVVGLAVDASGNIYLTDGPGPIVRKLSPSGALLATFGSAAPTSGSSSLPAAIGVDEADDVYVTGAATNRVDEYAPGGTLIRQWGGPGPNPGQFHLPSGLAVDSRGDVYLADSGNNRFQKLTRTCIGGVQDCF